MIKKIKPEEYFNSDNNKPQKQEFSSPQYVNEVAETPTNNKSFFSNINWSLVAITGIVIVGVVGIVAITAISKREK